MSDEKQTTAMWELANIVHGMLHCIDPNPNRPGLKETPERVAKAWQHWCGGYSVDVDDLFKTFDDGAERYDQMVSVRNIPFYSHCEHHLAPFFGVATISYIPKDRIVGLSKLSRVLSAYSRRLQVQERLTVQIADALQKNLKPQGVGVYIRARHLCMESRGIQQQGHDTVTTSLQGCYSREPAKSEFLALANNS